MRQYPTTTSFYCFFDTIPYGILMQRMYCYNEMALKRMREYIYIFFLFYQKLTKYANDKEFNLQK